MIRILAVGRLRADWARTACDDYARRAGRFARLEVVEVPDADPVREGRALLDATGTEPLVACDRTGDDLSSEDLAALLGRFGSISFALGGPEGLDRAVLDHARRAVAFGRVTLPHELARVVLLEQVYRALSIRAGHPYHR